MISIRSPRSIQADSFRPDGGALGWHRCKSDRGSSPRHPTNRTNTGNSAGPETLAGDGVRSTFRRQDRGRRHAHEAARDR